MPRRRRRVRSGTARRMTWYIGTRKISTSDVGLPLPATGHADRSRLKLSAGGAAAVRHPNSRAPTAPPAAVVPARARLIRQT